MGNLSTAYGGRGQLIGQKLIRDEGQRKLVMYRLSFAVGGRTRSRDPPPLVAHTSQAESPATNSPIARLSTL